MPALPVLVTVKIGAIDAPSDDDVPMLNEALLRNAILPAPPLEPPNKYMDEDCVPDCSLLRKRFAVPALASISRFASGLVVPMPTLPKARPMLMPFGVQGDTPSPTVPVPVTTTGAPSVLNEPVMACEASVSVG